jgi:hypothetical protein
MTMSERRYSEAEVAAIFKRAAEAQQKEQTLVPLSKGMTLTQLQDIGREVGLAADQIAAAARTIDTTGRVFSRRFLGFPIGVGRTIELDRRLSDEEWERFVVDLRDTFDARGRLRADGGFRQWSNGNLQALLEPTPTGHRIRLRTFKAQALSQIVGGLGLIGVAVASVLTAAMTGGVASGEKFTPVAFMAALGVIFLGLAALRLPSWARLRQQQMLELAERITSASP